MQLTEQEFVSLLTERDLHRWAPLFKDFEIHPFLRYYSYLLLHLPSEYHGEAFPFMTLGIDYAQELRQLRFRGFVPKTYKEESFYSCMHDLDIAIPYERKRKVEYRKGPAFDSLRALGLGRGPFPLEIVFGPKDFQKDGVIVPLVGDH